MFTEGSGVPGAVRQSGGVSLSHPQLPDLSQGSEEQTPPLEGLGGQSHGYNDIL